MINKTSSRTFSKATFGLLDGIERIMGEREIELICLSVRLSAAASEVFGGFQLCVSVCVCV